MKPPQEGRNTGAPWLRGLQGRSATGLNVQAAKEEVSVLWGWMPENISGVPAGRSVFHLTSPLIGLSVKGQNALWRYYASSADSIPNRSSTMTKGQSCRTSGISATKIGSSETGNHIVQ